MAFLEEMERDEKGTRIVVGVVGEHGVDAGIGCDDD